MVSGLKIKADDTKHSRAAFMRRAFWNFRMRVSHACCPHSSESIITCFLEKWATRSAGTSPARLMFVRVGRGVRPHCPPAVVAPINATSRLAWRATSRVPDGQRAHRGRIEPDASIIAVCAIANETARYLNLPSINAHMLRRVVTWL